MFDINVLLMTGFEPRTSGVGSDRYTCWATTTAQPYSPHVECSLLLGFSDCAYLRYDTTGGVS